MYFFDMLSTLEQGWITVAMVVAIGLVYACLYGPEGSLFSNQFPSEVRYSGISLAVQISGAIGGGLAPIVATWLRSEEHTSELQSLIRISYAVFCLKKKLKH